MSTHRIESKVKAPRILELQQDTDQQRAGYIVSAKHILTGTSCAFSLRDFRTCVSLLVRLMPQHASSRQQGRAALMRPETLESLMELMLCNRSERLRSRQSSIYC